MEIITALRPASPLDCVATIAHSEFIAPTIKQIQVILDQPQFMFLPGQSLWPQFERDGKSFSKIYSIASSPHLLPRVDLCVSRVGWSSAYLQDLQPGSTIAARGPYGLLTIADRPTRPQLYLAEGSGIAPLKSHLDWLHAIGCTTPLGLIQANPETPDCLPYSEHWQQRAATWPNFHYIPALNSTPEAALAALPEPLSAWDIYICAINRRTLDLQHTAIAAGALPAQIRVETFHSF